MKFTQVLLLAVIVVSAACASVKTRKEAAEEAKMKSASEEPSTALNTTPINEDSESESESYPAVGEAKADGEQAPPTTPVEDQILDDELAAMGIDPENTSGANQGTPEPEVNSPSYPEPTQVAKPVATRAVKKKAGPKKTAVKSKKSAKNSKAKKKPGSKKVAAKKSAKKKKPVEKQ